MFSKNSDERFSKMERGHDYVDYDSPPQVCGKFLDVLTYCLFSTKKNPGCFCENFSEASGPEIIIVEILGFFRTLHLVEKGC